MAKLTRSNIAYDLTISPHVYNVSYDDFRMDFVFSSELYMNKFAEKMKENRDKINTSLSNRFGFDVCAGSLADLKLYTTIEKRGFLVYKDGVQLCEKSITLDGLTPITRS